MRKPTFKKLKKNFINFLVEATRNKSQCKYIAFNYLQGTIFGIILWKYIIFELCFGIDPIWFLFIVVIVFGNSLIQLMSNQKSDVQVRTTFERNSKDFVWISERNLQSTDCVGCSMSIRVRCVVALFWIEFLGKTGINLLKAWVLIALITGPVENLKSNAKEVFRVFQCSSELMFNLTISKMMLLSKPFQNAVRETSSNLSQIQDSLDMITDVVRPIANEIETPFNETDVEKVSNGTRPARTADVQQNDAKLFQQQYVTKINDRCKVQMESAVKKCDKSFSDAYDRCYDKLPSVVNTLLCWPMKLDALCNVLKAGDTEKLCDSSSVIDRDFGDTYVELKALEQSLQKQKNDKVEIDTNVSVNPSAEIQTMKEINKKFSQEIEDKSKAVSGFIFVIRKILSLVLLRTVYGAYTYYRKYMTKIEFDNRFVTEYFEKIDLRRKNRRQSHLLPLKKIERKTITVSKSSRVKLNELWFMFPFLVKLLFEVIFSSCILIFNHLLYVSLKSVAQHGEVTYHQEGELIVETFVNGTGVVAMMVRQFLNNFNINENVSTVFSNFECLPKPNKLSIWFIIKIYGLYCIIIFYKLNLALAQRLRTNVMAIHFPKREKKRILYLYNECLKNRKRLRKMIKKLLIRKLRNATGAVDENPLRVLVNRFPRFFDWLKVFPCLRNKCYICNKVESYGRDGRLIDSNEIDGLYCSECCEEYKDVLEEIRLRFSSGSESGSSQDTNDSDSTD